MAKTLTATSIADAYSDFANLVILDKIGPAKGGSPTYTVLVNSRVAPVLDEYRVYVNRNWDNAANKGKPLVEKLAWAVELANTFETTAPKAVVALDKMIAGVIAQSYPNSVPVQKYLASGKIEELSANIAKFLHSASLEKYGSMLDAMPALIAPGTTPTGTRIVRNVGATSENEEEINFD